jgi:2-polyprenyl-6-methoxyphenol hydroxylase-like FAD-dependent oxidoreductase
VSARVAVVGAGPAGVVAALACARKGMDVSLFEAEQEIDHAPRAATTHPSTLEMLAELDLVEEFISLGLVARYFELWDRDTRVARFDHDVLRDETPFPYVVQTEQHKLSELGLRRLAAMPNVRVRLGARVLDLVQDERRVGLYVEGDAGRETRDFDYAIACDGGRSTLRKCLDIEFEGYTWPERFLVLTTLVDMGKALGCCERTYVSDPDEWVNLFKVTGDDFRGRWRAVFPAREDESDDTAFSDGEVLRRLRRLVPGHPLELVVHRNLYRVHQRVAQSFRRGRVFLAGDAAHINNPVGGLGLNCGIHDAMDLAETLEQVSTGRAGPELLDRYERRRRPLNIEYVQQQTIANKKRLEEREARVRRANFDEMRRIADDPKLHKEYLMRTSLIESVRKARGIA